MSNKFSPNPRTYSKRNFIEILELITPEFYQSDDITLSGLELDPISDIINRHVQAADNISTVLSLSAVANSQTSALNNISGISQYFVKQNELTKINPYIFETKILNPLGYTMLLFDTSSKYSDYLSNTLLPMIVPATGSEPGGLEANISTLSALTSDSNPSSVHNYLADALGWFYFLNTSADGGLEWDPSGYVLSSLITLHTGGKLETQEGLRGFQEYLWRNYETCTTFSNLNLIPTSFVSGVSDTITDVSAGVPAYYTSGTQKLENLQTLVDVIYSPAYMDQQDYRVEDAFNDYMNASTQLSDEISKGPLRKYLTAMGFSIADITEQIEQIGVIYDIDNAKDEYLQYIADLIGWELWGASPSKWRQQLKTAVEVYKRKGTKDALNYAISSILSDNFSDIGAKVEELWESYIPYLIWYCLGTGSPHFKSLNTWTPGLATQAGVWDYSTSSLEQNLKIVTDYILLDVYKKFPDHFMFYKDRFPVARLLELDEFGIPSKYNKNPADVYCIVFEKGAAPYHIHKPGDSDYIEKEAEAKYYNEFAQWKAAHSTGPLGYGVYMAGLGHPTTNERPTYLSATGDLDFVFNFRGHKNFPIPPFEEIKYYKECSLSSEIAEYIKKRLICFGVTESLATQLEQFILTEGITTHTDLGSLNEFLMLFSGVQTPPNYDDVLFNISDYDSNILGLWNGKSSHIFVNFSSSEFDFTNTVLGGGGKYSLYESARVTKKFIPAHAIAKINLSASALDVGTHDETSWDYLGYDRDDSFASYSSGAVTTGFEVSGVAMGSVSPGTDDGRGGLNTFKRADVDIITDNLLSSTTGITTAPRRSQRRRNFRYTLPLEGYYDRTGFNSPVNWGFEAQNPNLISYSVAPILDPGIYPDPTDVQGHYWTRTSNNLGSVSSVVLSNPGGETSAIVLSGGADTTSKRLGLVQLNPRASLYGGTAINSRMPIVLADKTITWSAYVKRAPTPTLSTSSCSMWFTGFDAAGTSQVSKGDTQFAWLSDDPATSSVLTVKSEDASYPTTLEDAGDGWTRISVSVPGNPWGSHMESSGIWTVITLGDTGAGTLSDGTNVQYKSMYWYGPQVEQWDTSLSKTVPTAYQPVSGASPDISTYNDRGELTLGYVASAGQFFPVVDPVNPSGVWHQCENLNSTKSFSGIDTSTTFPYRGLSALGSDAKNTDVLSSTARYIDRWQTPLIYIAMHESYENKAQENAKNIIKNNSSAYLGDDYWKNNIQSLANEAIASGFVLNSFDDYLNFKFGKGLQKIHHEYCTYFQKHPLGYTEVDKTGGNMIAQVFGKGLYNCDFDLTGYAATTMAGTYVASSTQVNLPLSENHGSGVFSTCAVAAYSDGAALPASGTYIAKYPAQGVVPLVGTYTLESPFNAEFRNPNILSGIEFTNTSGSPSGNEFYIFKITPSAVNQKSKTFVTDNTMIKCKSLGGLPRMRFNLKDYGDRPNHFIKDHKFKLGVKALVAEENSTVLGGGVIGAWIHTEPEYSNNYFPWTSYNASGNSTLYPPNEGLARILNNARLIPNSPPQVADIPPGFESKFFYEASGTSALEMTYETTDEDSWTYIGAVNTSATISEDQEYVFSLYARTAGYTNNTSAIAINMYENTGTSKSYTAAWTWDVATGIPVFHSVTSSKTKYKAEPVGNGWYRFSIAMTGKDLLENAAGDAGDMLRLIWYMDLPGNHGNIQGKKLRFYGPQMEVYDRGTNKAIRNGQANPGPLRWVPIIDQKEAPPRYMWSWTPNGKWEMHKEDDLSLDVVMNELCHQKKFDVENLTMLDIKSSCLGNIDVANAGSEVINNLPLEDIQEKYFEDFEIEFDTRNYTIYNNYEYKEIIPVPDVYNKLNPNNLVHKDDTNYVVEIFFRPNTNAAKYLLIDSIELTDLTNEDRCGVGLGYGVETSGIPLRPFVYEEKRKFDKNQLREFLNFFNGLIASGPAQYNTVVSTRDAIISSGTMEVSGGSRLNYRISPIWVSGAADGNTNQITEITMDN